MTNYSMLTIRIPAEVEKLLNELRDCHKEYGTACLNLQHHQENFTEDMQRAIDANDHQFEALMDHEIKGQELVDEMEEKKERLVFAAQGLGVWWNSVNLPF